MTSRTACQSLLRLNVIQFHQRLAVVNFRFAAIHLTPFHIENFVFVAHEFLRLAMASQAPLHLQRRRLENNRHLIDATMTGRAADSLIHMNAVIEIDVIGKIVNPRPLKRFAGAETCTHWLQIGTIGPNLFMAIHANGGRGNSRGRLSFDGSMTITTIDAVVSHMMFMAELNGLLNLNKLAGVPGRATNLSRNPQRGYQNKDSPKDRGLGQRVRTVVKNLWHRRS